MEHLKSLFAGDGALTSEPGLSLNLRFSVGQEKHHSNSNLQTARSKGLQSK